MYFLFGSDTYSIRSFVKGFVLGTTNYHLYYVPITILLYLYYPIILKVGRTNTGLLLSLIITVTSQISDYIIDLPFFNAPQNIFNWLFYFVFGIWLAHDYERKLKIIRKNRKKIIVLLIVSLAFIVSQNLIISVGEYTTSMRPIIIVYSISFSLLILISRFNVEILNTFSKESYGIYLSHAFILSLFEKMWDMLDFSKGNLTFMILMIILIPLLSIYLSRVIIQVLGLFRITKTQLQ